MHSQENRWAGSQESSRPPGRSRWAAGTLVTLGTALLVWSGGAIAAGGALDPAAAPSPRVVVDYGPAHRPDGNRRFVKASRPPPLPIEAPLQPTAPTLRSGGAKVQRPADLLEPTSIRIPSLGIDKDLTELGVIGTDLQVPDDYSDIGWWRSGPAPGEQGAAVMVGHLDSPTGPAVFYRLSELNAGDKIRIRLDDGSRTVFAIREVRSFNRSAFPSATVYRPDGLPTLHLLTCGGTFDTEAQAYSDNVVAFAELVKRIPPPGDEPNWAKRLTRDSERRLATDGDKPADQSVRRSRHDSERRLATDEDDQPSWVQRLMRDSERRLATDEGKIDRELRR